MKKESTKTKMVNDTLSSDRLIVSSNQSRTQEKKNFIIQDYIILVNI